MSEKEFLHWEVLLLLAVNGRDQFLDTGHLVDNTNLAAFEFAVEHNSLVVPHLVMETMVHRRVKFESVRERLVDSPLRLRPSTCYNHCSTKIGAY